jgi:uncharacterized phage protein gp47/JayE
MINFTIPSLANLTEAVRQSFKSELPSSDPWLFPSNVYVAAKVIAGRLWESYKRLGWVFKQAFVLTATGIYLDRHAQQYGIYRKSADFSGGQIRITGADTGSVLPAGTKLQRADGLQYVTTSDAAASSAGLIMASISAAATGPDYNCASGTTLTLLAVIAGVPATARAATAIANGSVEESDEDLRARVLLRLQRPPHGGSRYDYEQWALSVPGVTRVWVEGNAFGAGTVGVWFMMDDTYPDGIPKPEDVESVQAHLSAQAPVTAIVKVLAPVSAPTIIQIAGLTPNTVAVRNAVLAELKTAMREKSQASTPKEPFTFRRSWVWQAVSNATGEQYHNVTTPAADFVVPPGYIMAFDPAKVSFV